MNNFAAAHLRVFFRAFAYNGCIPAPDYDDMFKSLPALGRHISRLKRDDKKGEIEVLRGSIRVLLDGESRLDGLTIDELFCRLEEKVSIVAKEKGRGPDHSNGLTDETEAEI